MDEIDKQILNLIKKDYTRKEIGDILKISQSNISIRIKRLRNSGVVVAENKNKLDKIDLEILKLVEKGLTQNEISKRTGLSIGSISYRLKKMRDNGIVIIKHPRISKSIINEKIIELAKKGLKQKEIANELNLSNSNVSTRISNMRARGIIIPKKSQFDELKIIELLKEGLSINEIAQKMGLCSASISKKIEKMRRNGIEIPSKIEHDIINRNIVELMKNGLSITEISRELGISGQTIASRIRKMKKNGIIFPTIPKTNVTDEQIIELLSDGISQKEIAKRLNLSNSNISMRIKKMKKNGIIKEKPRIYSEDEIYDLRKKGYSYLKIANKFKEDGIQVSTETIRRKYKKVLIEEQKLAKLILNLTQSRHATLEQIKVIADYYGVDLNRTLNSLEER